MRFILLLLTACGCFASEDECPQDNAIPIPCLPPQNPEKSFLCQEMNGVVKRIEWDNAKSWPRNSWLPGTIAGDQFYDCDCNPIPVQEARDETLHRLEIALWDNSFPAGFEQFEEFVQFLYTVFTPNGTQDGPLGYLTEPLFIAEYLTLLKPGLNGNIGAFPSWERIGDVIRDGDTYFVDYNTQLFSQLFKIEDGSLIATNGPGDVLSDMELIFSPCSVLFELQIITPPAPTDFADSVSRWRLDYIGAPNIATRICLIDQTYCTGDLQNYGSLEECIGFLLSLPYACADDARFFFGDTIQCRETHSLMSILDSEHHCVHLSPDSPPCQLQGCPVYDRCVREDNAMHFGSLLEELMLENWDGCCENCRSNPKCSGFNYNYLSSQCYLLSGEIQRVDDICDAGDESATWTTGTSPKKSDPPQCQGFCGTKSGIADCWCDTSCAYYDDCCDSICDVCDCDLQNDLPRIGYRGTPSVSLPLAVAGGVVGIGVFVYVLKKRRFN